jgi:hypothetical protein
VVPNFFLPPQQLEASLRMLSLSTALPPPATADQVRTATDLPLLECQHLFPKSASVELPDCLLGEALAVDTLALSIFRRPSNRQGDQEM